MNLPWRPGYLFVLPTAIGLILLWLAATIFCAFDRDAALEMARRDTRYLSAVFAADAAYSFETADRDLLALRDDIRRNPAIDLKTEADKAALVSDFIIGFYTYGADGLATRATSPFTGRVSITDRPYFAALKSARDDKPIIFGPITGRLSHRWSIVLTRRLTGPAGGFAGVIIASLDPFYFTRFYQSLDIGSKGRALLFTTDGDLLAETGLSADRLAQHARLTDLGAIARAQAFTFATLPDPTTGREKLFAVRRLADYPQLAVAIGLDRTAILAPVALRRAIILAAAAVLSILIVAMALRLRAANARLYHMATTDDLTGFSGRRHFLGALETEIRRSARYAQPFALAIFDLDRFKTINDTYGHPAGDAVLRAIADCVRETVRETDLAGRLGGEEFGLLMPATDLPGAAILCDRLRLAVAHLAMPVDDAVIHATISIGITDFRRGDEGPVMMARADQALYSAKEAGRNRIEIAD